MPTAKFNNILSDLLNSKLRWCYKKYANKDDANLPNLVCNLGYYPKSIKELIEKRDPNCVDELTELLLEVLKNQSSSSFDNEDSMYCYYNFKRRYGNPTSRSDLGKIYNNITTAWRDGQEVAIKNDGWALITRLLNVAMEYGYLPSKWVGYISDLMRRAKFIAGRKPEDMSRKDLQISTKNFNTVILKMMFDLDNFGEEPTVLTWNYDAEIDYVLLSHSDGYPVFDYHSFNGVENINLANHSVNHYGVEWELDFKSRRNYNKCIRALIKAGIMFDKSNTKFNIIPMYDGSIDGSFGVEMIFAADTKENIIKKLNIAKGIFKKYGVSSCSEKNHTGIHITQDFSYLKGNAFWYLANYINDEIPMSEYLLHTKRAPNSYCSRSLSVYEWIHSTDGKFHTLKTDRHYSRYYALNVDNVCDNRLEWRMFNSCCDPVECVNWVDSLNETFNAKAKAELEAEAGKDGE